MDLDAQQSWARHIALLLEDTASVHESEGRTALARHHRRAARRLNDAEPA